MIVATDTFVRFARRIASTQGFPHLVIVTTPNPLRIGADEAMRERAQALMGPIIEGLTSSPQDIERRTRDIARLQIRPAGLVRSSTAI